MLDILRKRKRSWVILFLLGIIVLVFVLWGVGSYTNQARLENVAMVNGEVISARELEIRYQKALASFRQLFRRTMTREDIESLNIRSSVLNQIIQNRLLLQEAQRIGLLVADEELMDTIASMPAFQVDGNFNEDLYRRILSANRITPGRFEKEQREEITIQRLFDIIRDSIHVTETELRDRYRLENERLNIYFIHLPAKDFMQQTKVTAEDIKEYYEQNKVALREPLRVQVEYLTYPFTHFSAKVQVSQKEIEDFYNVTRESRFREPKAVKLQHYLSSAPAEESSEEEREKARLKAEGVLSEARDGKDFAQLVKQHSDDPSAAQKGDAGFFTPGQLLPPLEEVAFSLNKGEISNVVETPSGFHVLKVEEIREERIKSLQEAEEEIIRTIKEDQGRNEAVRAAETDREKARDGTTISELAKERQLPVKVSRFFTRNEVLLEIGPVEAFYKTAFALSSKQISPVVEGPKTAFLMNLKGRKEPMVPPLDTISSDLEKILKDNAAMELATKKATLLLGQLKEKKDINAFAGQHNLQLKETGFFRRKDTEFPEIGTLQEVQPNGLLISSQLPIPDQIFTVRDAAYILAFKESQDADMNVFEKEKALLKENTLREKHQRALQRFIESLKVKARIEVKPEALEGI
jgi:peptidyl-prolyl cis-trans isomerase D